VGVTWETHRVTTNGTTCLPAHIFSRRRCSRAINSPRRYPGSSFVRLVKFLGGTQPMSRSEAYCREPSEPVSEDIQAELMRLISRDDEGFQAQSLWATFAPVSQSHTQTSSRSTTFLSFRCYVRYLDDSARTMCLHIHLVRSVRAGIDSVVVVVVARPRDVEWSERT
jgi:hypothetical protein